MLTRIDILANLNNRPKVMKWLNRVLIATTIFAAAFWWWSAAVPLPAPKAYFDQAPENDPFLEALRHSANLSGYAAGLAAISAFLTAAMSWISGQNIWLPPRLKGPLERLAGYKPPP